MTVTINSIYFIIDMKLVYSAPKAEMVPVLVEEGFLGLSGGQGNATGEDMTVTTEEDW